MGETCLLRSNVEHETIWMIVMRSYWITLTILYSWQDVISYIA
jgi:hypothetical protein